jgi:hypothetical protein
MLEKEINEPITVFEIEQMPKWTRVHQFFKPIIIGIKISLILLPLAILFNAYSFAAVLLLILLVLLEIILIRISGFNHYIYKIETHNRVVTIHYLKNGKQNNFTVQNQNFRIRYYNSGHGSYFVFEQHQPYKLLIKQHAIGYWTMEKNIEVFQPYASKIVYNYGAYDKPKDEPLK